VKLSQLIFNSVATLAITCTAFAAEDTNEHLWKPRVTSVSVFKNGFGFFTRQGDVKLRDGWCVAGELPPAHFGTLAVYSHAKDQFVDIVGSGPGEVVEFDGVDAPKDPKSKLSRLQAAQFLKVQLTYVMKDTDRTAAGKLVSADSNFAILEADNSTFAVPVAGIKKMQVLELPLRVHVAAEKKTAGSATLGMAYLRKGITWIPEYTLRILDDSSAELSLRGTLVNEAEDLVHCDVNFVVGVPNFLHSDYLAPIAIGQVIRTIGAAVAPPEVMSQISSRAAFTRDSQKSEKFDSTQVINSESVPGGKDVSAVLGNLPQLESAGGTDFTVFTKKDITLRRGEKAVVTLFTKRITYSHIYRWSPPEVVRHFLVVSNTTDTAWTTGPCLALNDSGPLSEDLLRYVPKGGVGEFPVTTAVNIICDQKESESERKFKAHEPSSSFYVDQVFLQGELKIRNLEKSEVNVIIEAKVPGKPLEASADGAFASDATKLQLLDRAGVFRWRLKIGAAETKTASYKYERFVPSR
jgi:hypothetical protein